MAKRRRTENTIAKRRRTDNTMSKRRRTDKTMAKRRRTENTIAKRRRTDDTMTKRRRTDNTMAKRRRTDNTNANCIVFGLTRSGLESTIYHTRGEHANYYTLLFKCMLNRHKKPINILFLDSDSP
jgi:hypothetical protein